MQHGVCDAAFDICGRGWRREDWLGEIVMIRCRCIGRCLLRRICLDAFFCHVRFRRKHGQDGGRILVLAFPIFLLVAACTAGARAIQ
ncbi:hypothetical protein A989_10862 [Xanthomonas translucens DAR61454]|nr:hypothetical protein A989_10862 [Xanthomonas translucens DAR61454]